MKNVLKMIGKTGIAVLSLASLLIVSGSVQAMDFSGEWLGEKSDMMPDVSLENGFYTKYIWRGQNLGDEPVMQTDLAVSMYGLTFDFWTNYTLNSDKTKDGGRYEEYTEVDYSLDYTFTFSDLFDAMDTEHIEVLDPLSIAAGYIYYTFPNTDWDAEGFDSHEVYLSAAYDIFLQPSFTWYWDIDDGDGSYYVAGIGHTFEFEQDITADLGMTIAYNDSQWTDQSGWSDMVFSGSVTIPFMTYFTVTPSVGYSIVLDRDTYNDAQTNEFYGGISIGFAY